MAAHIPTQTFTGAHGDTMEGTKTVDQLKADALEMVKMMDPSLTHIDGSSGGVSVGNLRNGEAVSTKTASTLVLRDENGAAALDTSGTHTGPVAATTISASGQITSTVAEGTPPMVVASTTEVANLKSADSGKLEGMKWVEIVNGNSALSAGGTFNLDLRNGGQHNLYLYSCYATIENVYKETVANGVMSSIIQKPSGKDYFHVYNASASNVTIYYKIWVWE